MKQKNIDTFKEILLAIKKRSTCIRIQVGALITMDDRIISTGWNGTPAGMCHCCERFAGVNMNTPKFKKEHHDFSEKYESHAEMNAIAAAVKHGIRLDGTVMLTTLSPCSNCAKLIIGSGIKELYYIDVYDRSDAGLSLFVERNIPVLKI